MSRYLKGITPVISIILLLVITVGAVGVAYTQFQGILNQNTEQQVAEQQQVRNTELVFDSVYRNNTDTSRETAAPDVINITVRNTGSVTVNLSQSMQLSVVPEGSDSSLSIDVYGDTHGENHCFDRGVGSPQLEPGDSFTCKTSVAYPSGTESVGLEISMTGADKSWSYTCSPSSSTSVTC